MKITIVAPMESIAQTAREVCEKQDFDPVMVIEVVSGVLEAGLEQAYLAVEKGSDVIISRGGTASLISKNIDIPVVEIQVTAFDILRALNEFADISGPVGVVFIRKFLFECERLGELIGVPIREIFMENGTFDEEKIHNAYREGFCTFLGDALTYKLLQERGFRVFPIETSVDSITKSILEAMNIANVRRQEQEKAELFRTVLNGSAEGVIAINEDEQIIVFNSMAEQIFNISSLSAIGKPIGDIIPDDRLKDCLSGENYEQEGVKTIDDKIFAIKRFPINLNGKIVGAIANIQDVTQLQYFEQVVRQKLSRKGLVAKFHLEQLIGSSAVMGVVKKRIRQYATTDATVLITGETGTGKERAAQSIHNLSRRKSGPFLAVNCAALPEALLESELFGYEEGAFTGTKRGGKAGLFELAHGGTIFLDEIGEMPLALQTRILRVLQEKEVMRLGGDHIIPINVRVLAATNEDLITLVERKKFRADLYYRLDVLRLYMPSLRDRIDDLPELIQTFLNKDASLRSPKTKIAAVNLLQRHRWLGNIRELENVIERLRLLAHGPVIDEDDVRMELANISPQIADAVDDDLEASEKQRIEQILQEEKYNYTRAAKRAGISRSTLWRKLREWKNHN